MQGFIANTDLDWHGLLLRRQRAGGPIEEANFWKTSERATFKALKPGEPLLFRLKSPVDRIGGVGFFEGFSVLPVWLAWETFGLANGVPSRAAFEARLADLRRRNGMPERAELRVGCVLIVAPVLFEPEEYVELPADWKVRTVTGKGYDLANGEGARVWRDVQERLVARRVALLPGIAADERPRYGEPVAVRPRLGQGGFRIAVMDAYGRSCAITTEHSLPALEAAHIRPYAEDGGHDVTNGLLLRSDVHRLFDRGYVTVTPDYRFRVSDRLREDYANGRTYYALHDRPIALPGDARLLPSREALGWHGERRFLG